MHFFLGTLRVKFKRCCIQVSLFSFGDQSNILVENHRNIIYIYDEYLCEIICILACSLGPGVIKKYSCSTQLSMKFQLLIKTKIPTNKEDSCFKSPRC